VRRQTELCGDLVQVVVAELVASAHERIMHGPEIAEVTRSIFGQSGGVGRKLAIGERQVTVGVPQSITEAVAQVGYNLMGRVTVLARITPILDECDGR
jgi:hypothetical protein